MRQWLSLGGTGHNCSVGPPLGELAELRGMDAAGRRPARGGPRLRLRGPRGHGPRTHSRGPPAGVGPVPARGGGGRPEGRRPVPHRGPGRRIPLSLPAHHRGQTSAGGRLQALVVEDRPSMDTRNWVGAPAPDRAPTAGALDGPRGDRRPRGRPALPAFAAGAARFARGEGIWHGQDRVYVACTTGAGADRPGVHLPDRVRGRAPIANAPIPAPWNCSSSPTTPASWKWPTTSPWPRMGTFICEDGPDTNGLTRVTPEGRLERFAMNWANDSELAGPASAPMAARLREHPEAGCDAGDHRPGDAVEPLPAQGLLDPARSRRRRTRKIRQPSRARPELSRNTSETPRPRALLQSA